MTTIGKLAEEIKKILDAGNIQLAAKATWGEIRISICQVANALLKTEYFAVNLKNNEKIPNNTVLGTYTGIAISTYGTGKSTALLPARPIQLPRGIGVFSVYMEDDKDNEFIPMQMGQQSLAKSQPLLNDLFGQVTYEVKGMRLLFNKDLALLYAGKTLTCELAILDVSEYGDYDPFPVNPEMEWEIKKQVVALYSQEPIADLVVDSSNKEQQNVPVQQQRQTS